MLDDRNGFFISESLRVSSGFLQVRALQVAENPVTSIFVCTTCGDGLVLCTKLISKDCGKCS